ncbi:MAG: TetR/AcrR family transcriptional regulator, partial [Proteobacteria bacterium]
MMTKNPVGRPKIVTSNELVETRARIVEVSENLVVSRGYGGFSMGALAKDVGITKATIYHYFPDGKDELIKAVAHEMLGRYEVAISLAIESSLTPRAQLRAIAVCIVSGHGRAERMMQEAAVFFSTAYVEELRQTFV